MEQSEPPTVTSALPKDFTIIHIPHDEGSIQQYLPLYKAFRLLSLQVAPESFGSSYAREVDFDDSTWHDRLANPSAHNFLAIDNSTQEVISSSTMVGPLKTSPGALSTKGDPRAAIGMPEEGNPVHYRLNAIFTVPSGRRSGVSKATILASMKFAEEEAKEIASGRGMSNESVVITCVVDRMNAAANALYEKCGFRKFKEETLYLENAEGVECPREVILLKWSPSV